MTTQDLVEMEREREGPREGEREGWGKVKDTASIALFSFLWHKV